MKKKLLILALSLCLPITSFAGWRPRVPEKPVAPVTRGMQQGAMRHLEVPTSNARIPARRSNPAFEFGRKIGWKQETLKKFANSMQAKSIPFTSRIRFSRNLAMRARRIAKDIWAVKENTNTSKNHFYFDLLPEAFYNHVQFSDAQLRDIRAFYEKAISNPEIFTLDQAFADGLSGCLGISFVGDAYLAEKITSLAKSAPEGKRFLTDFVVVRSLLNLERYDLVQELMDFRQVQEGWFRDGQLVNEGETARVYEEVKLYQQTKKAIPVEFPEVLPGLNKIEFSQQDMCIVALMERGSRNAIMSSQNNNSPRSLHYLLKFKQLTHIVN